MNTNIKIAMKIITITFQLVFIALLGFVIYRYTLTCKSPLFSKEDITKCVTHNIYNSNGRTQILAIYKGPNKEDKGTLIIDATCLLSEFSTLKSKLIPEMNIQHSINIKNNKLMNVSMRSDRKKLSHNSRIDTTIHASIPNLKIVAFRYEPIETSEETD